MNFLFSRIGKNSVLSQLFGRNKILNLKFIKKYKTCVVLKRHLLCNSRFSDVISFLKKEDQRQTDSLTDFYSKTVLL